MKENIVLAVYSVFLASMWYYVGYTSNKTTITFTQVKYAQSLCKQGAWKEINKAEIVCKDGGVYELEK